MPVWMKVAGKWGGILVLIALLISLVKTLIAFVGFVTVAIKVLIVLVFIALMLGIGVLLLKGWKESRSTRS